MKAVVINGSYHPKGIIVQLLQSFCKGLKQKQPQIKIETINLISTKFKYCQGCSICSEANHGLIGRCSQKDGLEKILKKMIAADVLVWASPIYCFGPTAILKKFMERCLPLVHPTKVLQSRVKKDKNKKAIIIVSSGAPTPINHLVGITQYPLRSLKMFSGLFGKGKIHTLTAGGMEANQKNFTKYIKQAYQLGKKI